MQADNIHEILSVRHLTPSAYVLRMTRRGLAFKAGQHLLLGKAGSIHNREYSVYSGENDDFFEVLIKEVDDGMVSKSLKRLKTGDKVQVEGPLGFFTIDPQLIKKTPFLFVATGSGIAPFHSFTKSYPQLKFTLLHGVRHGNEAYEKDHYPPENEVVCTSGDTTGRFHGRVTDYIKQNPVSKDTHCYLCGNFNMIHEVFEILEQQGVPADQVHAEVYF